MDVWMISGLDRKEEPRMTPRFRALQIGWMVVPFVYMGKLSGDYRGL